MRGASEASRIGMPSELNERWRDELLRGCGGRTAGRPAASSVGRGSGRSGVNIWNSVACEILTESASRERPRSEVSMLALRFCACLRSADDGGESGTARARGGVVSKAWAMPGGATMGTGVGCWNCASNVGIGAAVVGEPAYVRPADVDVGALPAIVGGRATRLGKLGNR